MASKPVSRATVAIRWTGGMLGLACVGLGGIAAGWSPTMRADLLARWPLVLGLLVAIGAVTTIAMSWRLAPMYVGALAGAIGLPGAVLTLARWAAWRSSLYSVEMLLVIMIGALPGILVFNWLSDRAVSS